MIPYFALKKFAEKQFFKSLGLMALDSFGAKETTAREPYAMQTYTDKQSPLYGNKELLQEYYNPELPIEKDPKDWDAEDLVNATNSPLYKYDTTLQNKAHEYINYRAKKHRFNGLW